MHFLQCKVSLLQCKVRGVPILPCVLSSPMMESFATYKLSVQYKCLITFLDALNESLVSPRERVVDGFAMQGGISIGAL